jgi:hypothetical protein
LRIISCCRGLTGFVATADLRGETRMKGKGEMRGSLRCGDKDAAGVEMTFDWLVEREQSTTGTRLRRRPVRKFITGSRIGST